MIIRITGAVALLLAITGCAPEPESVSAEDAIPTVAAPVVAAATPEDAGRYVVQIGGCNDCHTEGYLQSNGAVPESQWLAGSVVGFRGPWGTSYPANLRLSVQAMTEEQWVETFRSRDGLPPMPWPNLKLMAEADARAVYRYLRALGPTGELAPTALPPDVEPTTPWFDFVPKNLPVTTGG